jgi:hypothetical protein
MTIRTIANQQTYGDKLSKKGKEKGETWWHFFLKKKELSKKRSVGFWQVFTQKND